MSDPHQLNGTLAEAHTHFTQLQILGCDHLSNYFETPHWAIKDVSLPVLLLTVALFCLGDDASFPADSNTMRAWAEAWRGHHRPVR